MLVLIPYRRVVIHTTLALTRAVDILSEYVDEPAYRLLPTNVGRFEGVVSSNGFRISRVIRFRNTFRPMLYGRFHRSDQGTQIDVTFRMHRFVEGFLVLWCSPLCIVGAVAVLRGDWVGFLCLMPVLLVYLGVILFFNVELDKSLQLIARIFKPYELVA
jgi:hypothetical protein